jgi:hypothetical protein
LPASFPSPLPDDAWDPWLPAELAERLKDTSAIWYVVGGWALDLWHGAQTRDHEDLEFAVLPDSVFTFRDILFELDFFTAHDGQVAYLPAGSAPPADVAQLWGMDAAARCWRVDMMIERGTPQNWVYKRDPAISAPRADMVRFSRTRIPYLSPAAVLLFKAKQRRDKDEADFRQALPHLSGADRDMLRGWLDLAHPGHAWLELLSG